MHDLSEIIPIPSICMDVFNHVLLIDATDWSKISSDRYRIQFDISLYPYFIFREHSL